MKKIVLLLSALAITSSAFCAKDACTDQPKKYENMKCEKARDKSWTNKVLGKMKQKCNELGYQIREDIKIVANAAADCDLFTKLRVGGLFLWMLYVYFGSSLVDCGDRECLIQFGQLKGCYFKNGTTIHYNPSVKFLP